MSKKQKETGWFPVTLSPCIPAYISARYIGVIRLFGVILTGAAGRFVELQSKRLST